MGARIRLGSGAGGFPQDQQGVTLAVKHEDWQAGAIGKQIYQFSLIVLRDIGNEPHGRKINSSGTAERGSDEVIGGEKERAGNRCQRPSGS